MTGTKGGAPAVRVGCLLSIPLLVAGLAGCTTTSGNDQAEINTKTKFASADFGVPASPRVTTKKTSRHGGGHYQVGDPYEVAGKWYHPKVNPDYDKVGMASWYGPNFHGRLTANGEIYNEYMLTAAHPTLPLPCYARVTNEDTGDSVIVRVNDRGPFAKGRIIDLSNEAAKLLHMRVAGTAEVRVQYVGMAPLEGNDSSYLMASYRPGEGEPGVDPDTGAAGVMVAMNDTQGLPGVTITDSAVPVPSDPGNRATATPAAVPATALVSEPTPSAAQQGIQRALTPAIVPVPVDRPTLAADAGDSIPQPRDMAVSAYAAPHATAEPAVFGHVLAENELTPEAIVRAWNHGLVAQN